MGCLAQIGTRSVLICCMYRPPGYGREMNSIFIEQFKKFCEVPCDQILVCGDFNFGRINWETHFVSPGPESDAQKFYDCVQDCFMEQHVFEPTRKRGVNEPSDLYKVRI